MLRSEDVSGEHQAMLSTASASRVIVRGEEVNVDVTDRQQTKRG
jgi:hypothetical protein